MLATLTVYSACSSKQNEDPSEGGNFAGSGGTVDAAEMLTQGRNSTEFILSKSLHPLNLGLVLRIYLPDGTSPFDTGGVFPLAFGYHGSGGLTKEPEQPGQECTEELETTYREMTDFLLAQGVAVVWVDSFYSRDPRFCEDNDADFQQFAPPSMDSNLQQVVNRLYDTTAAENAVCQLTRFDCHRYMRIGTSEGSTAALLPSHRYIGHSLAQLFNPDDPNNELDKLPLVPYAALPANLPQPQFVMAISPGCGFYGAIPFSLDGDSNDLYYPGQDVFLEIGSSDDVPKDCSVEIGEGRRQLQAEEIQAREGISGDNYRYHVSIYPGEGHPLWESRQEDIKTKLLPLIQQFLK